MEQGGRRGCTIRARNQMADCEGRDRRTGERVEGGGKEALSWLGRVCGGHVKSSRSSRCIGFREGAVHGLLF